MIKAIFYANRGKYKDRETERGYYKTEADIRLRALALDWHYVIIDASVKDNSFQEINN